MNGHRDARRSRDSGFTLPELVLSIALMSLIATVMAMAIITSIRTAPKVSDRADSAIAVQGLTTFLPPDVDSTEPGAFDIDPATPSGCSGTDRGQNIVHLTWRETFAGTTTHVCRQLPVRDRRQHRHDRAVRLLGTVDAGQPERSQHDGEAEQHGPDGDAVRHRRRQQARPAHDRDRDVLGRRRRDRRCIEEPSGNAPAERHQPDHDHHEHDHHDDGRAQQRPDSRSGQPASPTRPRRSSSCSRPPTRTAIRSRSASAMCPQDGR